MTDLTREQLDALKVYATERGRYWKTALIGEWMNGRARGPLQQIRNSFGPQWLKRFQFRAYDGVVFNDGKPPWRAQP